MKDVEVMTVIRTNLLRRGKGKEDDPVRRIIQYWDMDGNLLTEVDPEKEENFAISSPSLR
ncbi:carboxypeptidase [bacterium]|nr:MAG: carboxypeptidase [bacterium]